MKGQEIINHIVKAKMPDREQVRENCVNQTVYKSSITKSTWVMRMASVSACAVVVLVAVFALGRNGIFDLPPVEHDDDPSMQAEEQYPNNTADTDANTIIPGLPDEEWPPEPNHAVVIPAIELQENIDGVEMDMIGLFVYQGRIYTQAAWYYNEDAQYIIDNLVGDKVGFAKGNIDEWSTQDEYAVEFAGSVDGDVYTVKGYDPWYRLCIMGSYDTPIINDGDTQYSGNALRQWVNFYECLNGYGVTNGYDLFVFNSLLEVRNGEVLSENWSNVKYQTHANWNDVPSKYTYHDLIGVTDEDIAAFFHEIFFGQFEDVTEGMGYAGAFYSPERKQTHLYVTMTDETILELQLFEGGYVGYRYLGWYFVKIPGEAFDAIFNACQ